MHADASPGVKGDARPMNVVALLFPGFQQLDLTGPFEVLARFEELKVHLVSKTLEPVTDTNGLRIVPDCTLADSPAADILLVPGGPGQIALMEDGEVLAFLRHQAAHARYAVSVCTGSLILAAAGLLTGYRATCHWLSLDQLRFFGAVPVSERVVIDRNRMTGAGVTSGIDLALTLAACLFGEERAKRVLLAMEYDPKPPFSGGSPASADPAIVASLRRASAAFQKQREEVAQRAAAAFSGLAGKANNAPQSTGQ
ncbi:MAG TPA: DJ-1/PfpI family protein [Methylocella sp.]|nr:DJ-1/PfpI family protein [Methylocella sp.]